MKNKILSIIIIFVCFFNLNTNVFASCMTGGQGSSTCTLTADFSLVVIGLSQTASVTCGSGYYACCNIDGLSATANCIAKIKHITPD